MRHVFLIVVLSFLIWPSERFSQSANDKTLDEQIVFFGKVLELKRPRYSDDDAPDFHFTVLYRVFRVCSGNIGEVKEIRIAHRYGTARGLKVGNQVCRIVRPTDVFRKAAQYTFELKGITVPETSIADYIFAGVNQQCDCTKK